MTRTLVPLVLPSLFQGLQDQDDDVRSVGASALIPLTATLNQYYANQVNYVTGIYVDCIGDNLIMTLQSEYFVVFTQIN